MKRQLGLILALLAGAAGCGYSLERETAKMERQKRGAAEVLRAHPDADSLAAAALFTARQAPAEALALITRATAAAPERPELAWLQIGICADVDGCDPAPFESRLRQLDAGNALGWLGALSRSHEANDEAAVDAALAAAGRAERADSYFTTLTVRLARATASADALPLPDALFLLVGEIAGIRLPDYSVVSRSCGTERLDRPGVREACRSLSAALMSGDTLISEMIGAALAKRSWPTDSPQWQAATEARRVYRYRSTALQETEWIGEWDEARAAVYLDLFAKHRREQHVVLAQLESLGIDPNPPADWVDERSP